jgi:hypothetical protein
MTSSTAPQVRSGCFCRFGLVPHEINRLWLFPDHRNLDVVSYYKSYACNTRSATSVGVVFA